MFFWDRRTARGGGGKREPRTIWAKYFFFLPFIIICSRPHSWHSSVSCPALFLCASDLLRTRCLLCNCRDWMHSKVARVAQVMEPVGGQRQGREGAKWRGIALCCSNKSRERCFISRGVLFVCLPAPSVYQSLLSYSQFVSWQNVVVFLWAYPPIKGEKSVSY